MNDYDIDNLVADAAPSVEHLDSPSLSPIMAELREEILLTDHSHRADATAATPPARQGRSLHRNNVGAAAWWGNRRLRVAALAAVITSLVLAGVGIWPGSAQSAWAGWTPNPPPASQGDTTAIGSACTSAVASHMPDPGQPIAVDIRGDGGFVVFDSGATCSAYRADDPSSFKVHTTSGSPTSNPYQDALAQLEPTGSLVAASASEGTDPANSYVWGVRSPDVDAVTLDTPYGPVQATISGSVWLAWWPEATGFDLTVTGTSAGGRTLVSEPFRTLLLDYDE